MTSRDPRPDTPPPLWEVVPIGEYAVPSTLDSATVRKKWSALGRVFGMGSKRVQSPLRAETDLRALPRIKLEHLAPPIDWSHGAAALEDALRDRAADGAPASCVRVLVGQPFAGQAEILEQWALAHEAAVILPPNPEAILAGDTSPLDDWVGRMEAQPDCPWVLPRLEHWYFRHAGGLRLARRLFEAAFAGRLGRGLIGCDSWAWAYLQRIWPFPGVEVLTLQGFDGRRLGVYFLESARADRDKPVRFCHAKTGENLLPDPDSDSERDTPDRDDFPVSVELKRLAAHCRGNLGIARIYWRNRLRAEPDGDDDTTEDVDADKSAMHPDEETVWLSAGIEDPVLPAETGEEVVLVLHALLLHNGPPEGVLPELLPLSQDRILSILLRMKDLGLVQAHSDRWRIAPLGYATAREALRARGYLIDAF
ncbi:hypothetical protein [Thiocapsa marina]|uniref:Uncharacterized protein n=1 Tax=Thiocapsa marina 5811 TaxID=768671 RepID=F9UAB9_9GAMM|nr:hypothetical protein [Thiocapsa marina]EGV19067.1 hypothetical protein ThimaDRAFT_1871 [Thiocapsa marina 5811]